VKYEDDEKEMITLDSTVELQEAVRINLQKSNASLVCIRLEIFLNLLRLLLKLLSFALFPKSQEDHLVLITLTMEDNIGVNNNAKLIIMLLLVTFLEKN